MRPTPKGKIFPRYPVTLHSFLLMPFILKRTGVALDGYYLPSYKMLSPVGIGIGIHEAVRDGNCSKKFAIGS
jgi:hypothetical protein